MNRLLTEWSDFSKGDRGWVDKSKVDVGYYLAEQMVTYRDGSIGPRSGMRDLASTGMPAGNVFNLGYVDMAANGTEYVWMHKGTAIARVPVYNSSGKVLSGQAWAAAAGAAVVANTSDAVEYDPNITMLTVFGSHIFKLDWATGANGTVTSLAATTGGKCIELFNEFLVVANVSGAPNRVMWSSAGDFTNQPAANFFDVGASGIGAPAIVAMRRLRDQLLIWTDTGQLFVVTGRLGANEVVREFMPGDRMSGPGGPWSIARTRDGTAWWTRREEVPNLADETYDLPSAVPVAFTGGQRTERLDLGGYLRQPGFPSNRLSQTTAVSGRSEKSLALFDYQTGRTLLGRQDAWTRHKLPANLYRVAIGSRGDAFGVESGSTPSLRAWQFELERPPWAFNGSGVATLPYDDVDAAAAYSPPPWFATPEFRTPDGSLITVDRVEVTLTSHNTGSALSNHLDVYVQQFDSLNADELLDPSSYSPADSHVGGGGAMVAGGQTIGCGAAFDEADPAVDHRHRVSFLVLADTLPAPAIRVLLQNVRGVSIQRIAVFGSTSSPVRT